MILGLLTRTDAVDTELVSSKVNLTERYRIRPQHHKSIHGPIRKPRITTQFRDHITIKHIELSRTKTTN